MADDRNERNAMLQIDIVHLDAMRIMMEQLDWNVPCTAVIEHREDIKTC